MVVGFESEPFSTLGVWVTRQHSQARAHRVENQFRDAQSQHSAIVVEKSFGFDIDRKPSRYAHFAFTFRWSTIAIPLMLDSQQ